MVAHAKARESNQDFHAFIDPADHREAVDFRGSFSGYERNAFFVNDGAGRYVDCAHGFGLDDDGDGRAVAAVDLDGDGDLDLAQLSLSRVQVLMNQAAPRQWLRVRLRAQSGEPLALGAIVEVDAGGRRQIDRVRLTMGFHTQVLPELHFGLGDAERADVTVRWPRGKAERFSNLPAGRIATLTEGGGQRLAAVPRWPASAQPQVRRVALDVPVLDLDGARSALAPTGKPVVVNVWAPWCAACTTEIPALAALHDRIGETTRFVGLSVERKDVSGVRRFAQRHGLDYPIRLATDAAVEAFFGAGAELALPATFVFDARGRLRRAFYRPVTAADVEGALRTGRTAAADHLVLFERAMDAKDPAAATRSLEAAVAAAGDDPATIAEIAQGYLRLRAVERAGALLEAAVETHPDVAELWAVLAAVRGQSGQVDAARDAIQQALALAPRHPMALNAAGMERMMAGARAAARRYFEQALEADPLFTLARANLRRLDRR